MRRFVFIALCITFAVLMNGQNSDEDFEWAIDLMLNATKANDSYRQAYIDFVYQYEKKDDYDIDNMTELHRHYQKYIDSDNYIIYLNQMYPENITVYKVIDGNITNEVNYTKTVYIYNHTYFSDIMDEDRLALLINNTYAEDEAPGASLETCNSITAIPDGYPGPYTNPWCQGVQNQGSWGTCWAFSSTAQAECNYALESGVKTKFSECEAAVCSGGGTPTGGGWADQVNEYYVTNGACANYPVAYPTCNTQSCQGCALTLKASNCSIFNTGAQNNDFLSANRELSMNHHAMSMNTIRLGSDFYHISAAAGSVPISSVCKETTIGYHSMAIEGTTTQWDSSWGSLWVKNSWGTGWGDNGYFWMSVDAYTSCDGNGFSWNVFEEDIHIGVEDPEEPEEETEEEETDGALSHMVVENVYYVLVMCFMVLFMR